MFFNFLRVAFRNLLRNKVYVAINTMGMGIAMACCLTAYLLIAFNIEFNSYFQEDKVKNLVKVVHHQIEEDGTQFKELMTPAVMAPLAAEEISSIEKYSRYTSAQIALSIESEAFYETVRFADADFFEMVDISLLKGSYENFKSQNTIFLTEDIATKYFASEEPVGRVMRAKFGEQLREVIVGGVIKDLPLNTSFNIDVLMRVETLLDVNHVAINDWAKNYNVSLLFEVSDINQINSIEKQMDKYVDLHNQKVSGTRSSRYQLIPFHQKISRDDVRQSDLRLPIPAIALFIFAALGGIILLIACFNLTNTTMALTGKRLKEIGVRKVIGSSRWQIITQFLMEMVVTICLAVIVSFLLAQLMIPEFAAMWSLDYGLEDLNGTNIIITMVGLLFVSAILAGIYPALFNSKFSPVILFRSKSGVKGTTGLTRVLLVFQFSLSVIMLCGGIILSQNMSFQKEIDFGYDYKNLIKLKIGGRQTFDRLSNSISNNSKITGIAVASNHIGPYNSYYRKVQLDTMKITSDSYRVGANYFETLGMRLLEGRNFEAGSLSDMESSVIVDQNFIKKYSLTDPIGAVLKMNDISYQIIGVVSNHLSSLKDLRNEHYMYLMARPAQYSWMTLRTHPDNREEISEIVGKKWKKLFPDTPYQAELQEDIIFKESNEFNQNLKNIFIFLTILGSLLSASGIYALANLNAQKRRKEIGVRKVLGASIANIVRLVNKEFMILLLISLLLGTLASYVFIEELLKSLYAQYQPVNVLSVVIGGLIILMVGLLTTSGTIYKAASANPVNTLKE
ncbi:MAG: ABC transporter permease [Bacteroidota bacterium]